MAGLAQCGSRGITTALIYTRVSSEDQRREGMSLDAQLADCRRYAAERGWLLSAEYEYQDVLKGTRDDRPRYQAVLTDARQLRAGGRSVAVVVAALDRFGRRLLERVRSREELKDLGVPTHSVREGGEVSDIVANVLAAVAQEEVRRLGERVGVVRSYLASNGWKLPGRAPWGYRWRPATAEERARGAPASVLEFDPVTGSYARNVPARRGRRERAQGGAVDRRTAVSGAVRSQPEVCEHPCSAFESRLREPPRGPPRVGRTPSAPGALARAGR